MTVSIDPEHAHQAGLIRCGYCDEPYHASEIACPYCGNDVAQPGASITEQIKRGPMTLPNDSNGGHYFDAHTTAIFQLLPSGICVSLQLETPVILGRDLSNPPEEKLDLTRFNAFQHGVSRRHCLLRRDNNRLMVTDLSSTNGTYLNDRRLIPYQDYAIAHGDRLILGTLHITVAFVDPLD